MQIFEIKVKESGSFVFIVDFVTEEIKYRDRYRLSILKTTCYLSLYSEKENETRILSTAYILKDSRDKDNPILARKIALSKVINNSNPLTRWIRKRIFEEIFNPK